MKRSNFAWLCFFASLVLMSGCNKTTTPRVATSKVYVSAADAAALSLTQKRADTCSVNKLRADLLRLRGADAWLSTYINSSTSTTKASLFALYVAPISNPGRCCPCPGGFGCQCLLASRAFVSVADWKVDMSIKADGDNTSPASFKEEVADDGITTHDFPAELKEGSYTLTISGTFNKEATDTLTFNMHVAIDDKGSLNLIE